MATDIQVKPSPAARELFGRMVARAHSGRRLHLSMEKTLELAVGRVKEGQRDAREIHELQDENWIKQAPDGGWFFC